MPSTKTKTITATVENHEEHDVQTMNTSNNEVVTENTVLSTSSDESDEFTKYCDEYLKQLSTEYKEKKNQVRHMMRLHKQSVTNARRNTRKRRSNTQTGFTKPEVVPSGLAKLIGVPEGTSMPRTELTKIVYKKISDRGLFYDKDKRVLRADDEIMKVFNLPATVNQSTSPNDENGLNFYNIQRHIARCYKNDTNTANVTAPQVIVAEAPVVVSAQVVEEQLEPVVTQAKPRQARQPRQTQQQKDTTAPTPNRRNKQAVAAPPS